MSDEVSGKPQDTPETDAISAVTKVELDKLRKLAGERDQYLDLAARTRAEFENYQKRMQREREQERKYAFGPIAESLLPLLDNLDRALVAAKQAGETGPLAQG